MHYIAGTSFTVAPQRLPASNSLRTGNLLPPGNAYQLFYIRKVEEGFEYHFVDMNRAKHTVLFKSARDADNYIALQRREKIPDYDAPKVDKVESF